LVPYTTLFRSGPLEFRAALGADARPFEAHAVEAAHVGRVPVHQDKRRHVHGHLRHAANHGQAPDPDKLVHAGHTTQHRLIFHCHHAGEANALGKDHVIAHDAVVADVHHGHHVVVAADPGNPPAGGRAPADGDIRPD